MFASPAVVWRRIATNISFERLGYAQMAITSDRMFVTLEIDRIFAFPVPCECD